MTMLFNCTTAGRVSDSVTIHTYFLLLCWWTMVSLPWFTNSLFSVLVISARWSRSRGLPIRSFLFWLSVHDGLALVVYQFALFCSGYQCTMVSLSWFTNSLFSVLAISARWSRSRGLPIRSFLFWLSVHDGLALVVYQFALFCSGYQCTMFSFSWFTNSLSSALAISARWSRFRGLPIRSFLFWLSVHDGLALVVYQFALFCSGYQYYFDYEPLAAFHHSGSKLNYMCPVWWIHRVC